MSQGTYGELELSGQGSSFTPAIARELGVSVDWLAYGKGEMKMDEKNPPARAANDEEEFSLFARSLARLYDSLPKDDHTALVKAYHAASAPLLLLLDPQPDGQPMPEPLHDPEKPAAASPKKKAPSK